MRRSSLWVKPLRDLGIALLPILTVAPLPAQVPSPPASQVTVGGVVYGHYAYFLSDTAGHGNNFDITRAYINVIGRFPHGIGTRVTPDIYRTTDGSLGYRLKYAFVTWTPEKSPITLKLGMVNTPFVEWEETLWDYRMQGTIALDRNNYLSSSDLGFLVDGNWGAERVTLSAGIMNGENYNKAPGDKRKDLGGRISVRLLGTDDPSRTGGLRVTGYGHYGKPTGGGVRERYVGVLSYRSTRLTLAAELAVTRDGVLTDPVTPRRTGRVLTGFGVFRIPNSKFGVIGRFDSVDPNTSVAGDRQDRIIAGVSYTMSPNLRILADLDHLSYQGGTTTPALEAARSQALFQVQFTF
ncbi:MAG TPA: hypothetical protein VJK71_03920 [Gemmatimonadales bacterium]|nr:hypothetical protein [Gemmatimonadales bacterium]